ncbi:MAG TPA: FG-GAP-like repeat-containing protein [Candidatus Binatia bacterium]|nr:FG-GAP-like repeat-containing protein [Candidatus Binatia bacterium]
MPSACYRFFYCPLVSLLGDGAGFFTALNTFTVESGPTAITAADFNGDNKLDLAVASLFLNEVSLLLGDGTGSFAPPTTFGVGDQPNSLVVGDFNRDGKKDLAVAAGNYGNIAILPGNGAGGFGSERHVNMGQDVSLLTSAVLANVTVDSKLDLVALATVEKQLPDLSFFRSGASVAIGKGTGGFAPLMHLPAVGNQNGAFFAVAVGDFNKDGKPDLALPDQFGSVSILLGDGTGQFPNGAMFAVGNASRSVATGDFNGDNNLDLVVANANDNNVSVLLGDGTGGFGTATNFLAGLAPKSVVVADFNKDNRADLVVLNEGDSTFSILLGNGVGGFGPAASFPVSSGSVLPVPEGLTVADFNKDGNLDIATANINSGDVSVLLGKGNGRFNPPQRFPGPGSANAIAAADFNGDGKLDLAVTNQFRNDVSILLGDGTGKFGLPTDFLVGNQPVSVSVGDLNGDGKPDLAVANQYSNSVSILLNTCKPPPPPPPAADLQLTNTDSPDPVLVNTNLTYTLTVTNNGPAAATNVTLSDTLPAGVTFVSASAACTGSSTVTCTLGTLAVNATAMVKIVVKSPTAGGLSNTAHVSSATSDPVPGNNTATAVTTIQNPFLTVLRPNGGEVWAIGSQRFIKWLSKGAGSAVKIQLSYDGGGTWVTLFSSTANDGNEPWTVSGPATSQARVRIRSVQTPTLVDTSDANFTIQ